VRAERPLQLVLVGMPGYGYARVKDAIAESPFKHDIRLLGWMEPEAIVRLMNAAEAFVFPSKYEGFGLPILEAFACGTPVIAGSGSSLEEVGSDAAAYADPRQTDDIARVIRYVLDHAETRRTMADKGRARVKQFSWKKSAEETIAVLLNGAVY
jgi:glycosyltransferase involved in cell wall biosynthesis